MPKLAAPRVQEDRVIVVRKTSSPWSVSREPRDREEATRRADEAAVHALTSPRGQCASLVHRRLLPVATLALDLVALDRAASPLTLRLELRVLRYRRVRDHHSRRDGDGRPRPRLVDGGYWRGRQFRQYHQIVGLADERRAHRTSARRVRGRVLEHL